jgi:hypothetical protein
LFILTFKFLEYPGSLWVVPITSFSTVLARIE